ncbi:MAG: hypothetical protein O0V67_10290 [Methanocorpusculum sp.]|nr:hypothetical protein [Methanocorpusculum sp.]
MIRKIFTGLLLVLLITTGAACADSSAVPSLPAQYFGTALTEEGKTIPSGTTVIAKLDGVSYPYTLKDDGKLGAAGTFGEKLIVDPAAVPADKTITFWIGSTKASETQTFTSGTATEIHLTFSFPKVTTQPNQNIPKVNGRDIFTEQPVVIAENSVPEDFSLTISPVKPENEERLPPLPENTKPLVIVDITPVNPPIGDYTILYPFTLTAYDFTALGVTKNDVIVLHNKGTIWEELIPAITQEHENGSVDYEIRMTAFSAYMIAAKTAASGESIGGGTESHATTQATTSQTKRPASSGGSAGGSGGSGTTTVKPTVTTTTTNPTTQLMTTAVPQTSVPAGTTASQPTLTQAPAPLAGLLSGLGAAALLLRRRD